ncbi:MAG: hypothetical protein FLDDKLPJ_00287 [Phycisphaerae bacterium]|nr:hypothetical protein [Phycisphaerae bacterium]
MHIWREQERVELRAELDAAYFHLYGIERDDVEYILSTFTNTGYVPADQREAPGGGREQGGAYRAWRRGGVGKEILTVYDRFAGGAA